MRLEKYLHELSMKKGTGFEIRQNPVEFMVDITLENYDEYSFYAGYDSEEDSWEVEFEHSVTGIRRRKVSPKIALELFAALEKAFTEFLKAKKPDSFSFSGSPDKIKLYDTIATKISRKAKYKLEIENDPTGGLIYFFDKN